MLTGDHDLRRSRPPGLGGLRRARRSLEAIDAPSSAVFAFARLQRCRVADATRSSATAGCHTVIVISARSGPVTVVGADRFAPAAVGDQPVSPFVCRPRSARSWFTIWAETEPCKSRRASSCADTSTRARQRWVGVAPVTRRRHRVGEDPLDGGVAVEVYDAEASTAQGDAAVIGDTVPARHAQRERARHSSGEGREASDASGLLSAKRPGGIFEADPPSTSKSACG